MKKLVIVPIEKERSSLLQSMALMGEQNELDTIGRLPVARFPKLDLVVAPGGLGKVQFAIQTQHLLEARPDWELVICAGAAGALADNLSVGDIVIATETLEHDFNNKFGPPRLPRFKTEEAALARFRQASSGFSSFQIHFGPVASGDEDIVDDVRKANIHQLTGALAVAWEGAGGARACQFSGIPFIEIRGITDAANSSAASDFRANLPGVMHNIAALIIDWAKISR